MELIGSLFLALVFIYSGFNNIRTIKKLKLMPIRTRSFKLTLTIGAAILFSFFVILGNAWYHYLIAVVSVISFVSVRLTKGISEQGIQNINYGVVAPYSKLYKWDEISSVQVVYSDLIEVYVQVENDEFEMFFDLKDNKEFEKAIEKMAENNVILKIYR